MLILWLVFVIVCVEFLSNDFFLLLFVHICIALEDSSIKKG